MNVYFLEQREEDVPESNDWLGRRERNHLSTLNFPKRRAEWRLGRWAAKCAMAAFQNIPPHPDLLARIQICAAPSGAPRLFLDEAPADVTISLSHRAGLALCALSRASVRLGCDLELIEPRSAAFVVDYFTPEEQELINRAASRDRWRMTAMLWSAKESALKALQEGLRRDTRSVTVKAARQSSGEGWSSVQVQSIEGDVFYGWWRESEGMVRTLVAGHASSVPICLHAPKFIMPNQASACDAG
jgi:4'-phosphopantetheinyl transferase